MSTILAIETATHACSAALKIGNRVEERFEIAPRRHNELILAFIDALFQQTGLSKQELDAVAFGQGPGSFMGVRLAAGVAQGIAFALEKPVVPVSTLQALAQAAYLKHGCERVLASWDARMDEIYEGAYEFGASGIVEIVRDDQLIAPKDYCCPHGGGWIFAGNAWNIYQERFPEDIFQGDEAILSDCYPRAAAIANIADVLFNQGVSVSPEAVAPIYLRSAI